MCQDAVEIHLVHLSELLAWWFVSLYVCLEDSLFASYAVSVDFRDNRISFGGRLASHWVDFVAEFEETPTFLWISIALRSVDLLTSLFLLFDGHLDAVDLLDGLRYSGDMRVGWLNKRLFYFYYVALLYRIYCLPLIVRIRVLAELSWLSAVE